MAAARLHFLKQLKRSGAGRDDLLCFYGTVIRPVLDYACPLSSVALKSHCRADEGTGVAAVRIIYHDGDYDILRIRAGLDTLESRRGQLTERFFNRSVIPETSCLHYLLPDKHHLTGRLRHARTLEPLKSRTVKFRHFFTLLFGSLYLGYIPQFADTAVLFFSVLFIFCNFVYCCVGYIVCKLIQPTGCHTIKSSSYSNGNLVYCITSSSASKNAKINGAKIISLL